MPILLFHTDGASVDGAVGKYTPPQHVRSLWRVRNMRLFQAHFEAVCNTDQILFSVLMFYKFSFLALKVISIVSRANDEVCYEMSKLRLQPHS